MADTNSLSQIRTSTCAAPNKILKEMNPAKYAAIA
jgi:hypothetical protein